MIYFAGCWHWQHKNIIRLANRPFADLKAMQADLIENVRAALKPDDELYYLGDSWCYSIKDIKDLFDQVPCKRIYYLMGNHDDCVKEAQEAIKPFVWVKDYHEFMLNNRRWVLSHYPLLSWNGSFKHSYMAHSHCHGNINHLNMGTNRIDIGYDAQKKWVLSIDEVLALIKVQNPNDNAAKI